MTEAEWLAADDPTPMLAALRAAGKLSERKARLYACGCVRRIWDLVGERGRGAIEVAERFADGAASVVDLAAALTRLGHSGRLRRAAEVAHVACWYAALDARAAGLGNPAYPQYPYDWGLASEASSRAREAEVLRAGDEAYRAVGRGGPATREAKTAEGRAQAGLLRCIIGTLPFRHVTVAAAWLAWNEGTVRRLAEAIYALRAFDRMPVLADALEEAGCDDAEMLAHCREQGRPHARGCWVVDLLAGKE